jgi:hypothetical protein
MLRAWVRIRSRNWEWPESLDALVAAPAHHFLVVENDRVRVLYTVIPPGDIVPLHTHRWPAVLYVEHWSDFIRRDQQGMSFQRISLTSPRILTRPIASFRPP